MALSLQDPGVTLIRRISDWTSPDLDPFSALRYLHCVHIDFLLLKAAVVFWDTHNHVFNFGGY